MPADPSVKFFRNTMSGAPASNGDPGTFIAIFDACLVNGFGSVTLDSLVVADNVATGTVSTGHGFAMTGATGPVIRIAGTTPAALNGDWRIQSIPASTAFTFSVSGIASQTATGTITAKRAPAGFSKVFSGANKAVYRADDVQSSRWYLRVDDSSTADAGWTVLQLFETMLDVNTGANGSSAKYLLRRASAAYNHLRNWRLYADPRAFYFITESLNNNDGWFGIGQCFFGDLAYPAVIADSAPCGLAAFATPSTGSTQTLPRIDDDAAGVLALSHNGITRNVALRRRGHMTNVNIVSNGGANYVANTGVLVKAVEAWEGSGYYRGIMPGWYGQVHNNLWNWRAMAYEHPQIGTLFGDNLYNSGDYNQFFDITGPWR